MVAIEALGEVLEVREREAEGATMYPMVLATPIHG